MIFRRQLITAATVSITLAVLLASTDAAHIEDTVVSRLLPTTDLVIPEKVDFATYSTSTSFIQAMSKSGGTEADCRTFADTTIRTIRTDVTSEQGILNAEDTGEDCADKGQDGVANAQGKKDAANKDQLAKQGVAATTLDNKKTACTASVAFIVTLDTLESSKCYDTAKEQSYINAKSTCTSATSAMTKADEAVTTAKTTVKDGHFALTQAQTHAAQLKSKCHCRVQRDQAAAWTAASEATAAHAADWKQAYEVICALDSATTCDIPTCPTVTQPTLSKDISSEYCPFTCRVCLEKYSSEVDSSCKWMVGDNCFHKRRPNCNLSKCYTDPRIIAQAKVSWQDEMAGP